MVETLGGLEAGTLIGRAQDDAQATLAPILTREDGLIDFARTAQQIYDRWRGFQPWPGAYTMLRVRKLIVHRMSLASQNSIAPGILQVCDGQMLVGCGAGADGNSTAIVLDEVQLEGKRRMAAAEFLRGFQLRSGERLGA
jgi:methionyl-tRNA formyltransferase